MQDAKKFKVIVTDYVFESFENEEKSLAEIGATLELHQCKSQNELTAVIKDADVILNTYLPGLDAKVFSYAPKLKGIVRYGIGLDTISISDATAAGIKVANVPDYCVEEVADHAMSLFLCMARKVALSDKKMKSGVVSLGYVKPLKGITSMTAGIIGFGRIGQAIASRLKPFGSKIVFSDPCIDDSKGLAEKVSLDELCETCDAIFVQCPANKHTHHLLDASRFASMRKSPIIINAARGQIIDTAALLDALQSGKASAAGLDVLEDEKQVIESDHPFRKMDNVILTPHSAWYSSDAIIKLQTQACQEVVRILKGENPKNFANPEVLENRK
ncbi:MAG TPA: C-terminal binding protein [Phycisphaerae bacterium]|nr:C-terminal binding protein [Phycisphaerae bacterium]